MALRPSGKSLSTELWILLASWHVTLKNLVASTMRTRLLLRLRLRLRLGGVGSAMTMLDIGSGHGHGHGHGSTIPWLWV